MSADEHTVVLDPGDAWAMIGSKSIGRLAVSFDGQPDIFPVNFLATITDILIRTDEGTKVERVAANALVAFEVDETDPQRAWSVVVKGIAQRLGEADAAAAAQAPLWTWAPEPTSVFLRIRPTEVTGRLFTRAGVR